MAAQRPLSDEIVQLALGAGSQVVKWLCLPVDPHVKDLDPSTDPNDGDAWRRAYNQADRDLANLEAGVTIADFAAAMEEGFDADGQALFDDSRFEDNRATDAGSAIYVRSSGPSGVVLRNRTLLQRNTAPSVRKNTYKFIRYPISFLDEFGRTITIFSKDRLQPRRTRSWKGTEKGVLDR